MHEKGEKVFRALCEMFPQVHIQAEERDFGQVLEIAFEAPGAKPFGIRTPSTMDYRERWSYQETLHNMATLARDKLT